MGEELKQTYTIRIPDPVAARIGEAARVMSASLLELGSGNIVS